MRLPSIGSIGLLGRIMLILGFVLAIEFAANTLVFERASQFALRGDEAHRMAEYLEVARRVLDKTSVADRPAVAEELSTPRLRLTWHSGIDTQDTRLPLKDLRQQMLVFEPRLVAAKLRLHLAPLREGGGIAGSIELGDHSTLRFLAQQEHGFWSFTLGRALALSVPMLALALLGGLMIRATLKPLRKLMGATRTVGAHQPVPVQEEGPSEVRALIRDFNAMQMRLHRMVKDRTQALAAVGHDLRTPLARLELRLEAASIDAQTRADMIDDIDEMGDLLSSLQIYLGGEADAIAPERIDLAVMASTIIDAARDAGHDATYQGPDTMEIRARAVSIRRAIGNLVENALHYAGNVRLSIRPGGEGTVIVVEDNGPGIPPEKLGSVLEPFVRLSEGRARNTRGMGLGLSIVDNAVRAEGGTLMLENRSGGGLIATIILPLAPPRSSPQT